ncbi:MAG: glycosyltransferase [Clostridia bacterium]|nr:glycosyltransferase [Clostridia bacterium]
MLDRILQFCKDEGKRDKVFQCVAYTFLGMLTILILFFRTFFAMPDWLDRLYINFTVATLFVAIVLHAPEIFKDRYLLILAIGLTVSLITSYCIQGTAMEYIRNTLFFLGTLAILPYIKLDKKVIWIFLTAYVLHFLILAIFARRSWQDTDAVIYRINENITSYVCFFAGALLLGFGSIVKNWKLRLVVYLLAIACMGTLLLFGGRTSMIAAICFGGYFILKGLFSKLKMRTIEIFVAVVFVFGIAVAYFYAEILYDWMGAEGLKFFGKDIFTGRQRVWSDAFSQLKGNVLFGLGYDFVTEYNQQGVVKTGINLHSQPMGYLVTFGIFAFLFYTLLLARLTVKTGAGKRMTVGFLIAAIISSYFEPCLFSTHIIIYQPIVLVLLYQFDANAAKKRRKTFAMQNEEVSTEETLRRTDKISVIVPVYNIVGYLEECVNTILKQTYPHLEIILIDDGSKDGSGELCDRLAEQDTRIRVIHKENGGVSLARNVGLDNATGDFVAFVDGDDYVDERIYEKLLNKTSNGEDAVFCRFEKNSSDGGVLKYFELSLENLVENPKELTPFMIFDSRKEGDIVYTHNIHGAIWRVLFKREIIERENIRFYQDVKIGEDKIFVLEYLSHCEKCALVDEYLYHYRIDRLDSAMTKLHEDYERYYNRGIEHLQGYTRFLENNKKLEPAQKDKYYALEKFDFAFNFLVKMLRATKDCKAVATRYKKDAVLQEAIQSVRIKDLKKAGYSFKRILPTILIKWRWFGILKLVSK